MLDSSAGKVTYPGFLFDNLSSQARFNDPGADTIFSHSRDIATFSQWRSRSSSRAGSRDPSPDARAASTTSNIKLHVPTGFNTPSQMVVMTPKGPIRLPSLHTPRSSGRSVKYCIYEYETLVDSSDIGFNDWIRMASDIEANYEHYDAFILLHGTDTMAYTASALSFLLENLGKPVILTGAQIPLSEVRNDAVDNLLGALALAGNFCIPEVTLFFHHTLFRGCRSTKSSSFDFEAFSSPNMLPLAKVGISIDIDWRSVLRPTVLKPFRVHKRLCQDVATLRLFPGITTASVKAFLASPLKGVVLSTYGAGNCPQRPDLLQAFKDATDRGVVIVNITQCQKGTVEALYENGRKLAAVGVVGGSDMTVEGALAKLAYLLAKDLTAEEVRRLMTDSIRGELTQPKPIITDLADSKYSKMKGLFARLLLLTPKSGSLPGAADLHRVAGQGISDNDLTSVEDALNPLLVASAAAKPDESLATLLEDLLGSEKAESQNGMMQGLGLLNNFTTHSPLHIACLHGIVKNVEILLQYGASVHLRDVSGHTALYYALTSHHATRDERKQMVQALRSAGAHLSQHEKSHGESLHDYDNELRQWSE
ncbi:asparaginase-domain-containing protein [Cystobasidium minutum MCA 4210]|uniref:asparaginase-domain-containing protein n=1 Tax=Cystobasidium minutum MCA 4210 TaxID=1397322 RepID=UPI0034CF6D5D|eukprot:jgi/Rhomi1/192796/gm1.1010_g